MIPRIIHRTLPAVPPADVDRIWRSTLANSAGWDHRTYQSPRDPADWPMTGHLFHLCRDKAEESDLVRLEALWVHGGLYLDSDMEVVRDVEWVVYESCLTGWEDEVSFGMGFIAAEPEHPAIGILMEKFTSHVEAQTERSTFPAVATRVWEGRTDVRVLPPRALYPYHYNEKHGGGRTHDWSQEPGVLAVHHWHGSWL